MKKPSVFIVGGSKCGSSTLAGLLNEHPEIYMPEGETHYFSREFYSSDLDYWLDNYYRGEEGADKRLWGDKSVTHVNSTTYLNGIKHYCGEDSKIIFMMRDPISKFLSWWTFMCDVAESKIREDYSVYPQSYYWSIFDEIGTDFNFAKWFDFQLERYYFLDEHQSYRMSSLNKIQLGRYDILLENIQSVFGDNCHYIFTEEFKAKRSQILSGVFDYVGVPNHNIPYFVRNKSNKKWLDQVEDRHIEILKDIYRPTVQYVYNKFGNKVTDLWRDYGIST